MFTCSTCGKGTTRLVAVHGNRLCSECVESELDEARDVAKSLMKEHADFEQEKSLIERYPWIDYYSDDTGEPNQ